MDMVWNELLEYLIPDPKNAWVRGTGGSPSAGREDAPKVALVVCAREDLRRGDGGGHLRRVRRGD
jgi:hypothetical protein